jgi:hypothetical protein
MDARSYALDQTWGMPLLYIAYLTGPSSKAWMSVKLQDNYKDYNKAQALSSLSEVEHVL